MLDPHADVDDGGAVATDVRLDLVQHADTSVLVHRVHRRGWGTFGAHAGRGYHLGASLARRLAAACRPWACMASSRSRSSSSWPGKWNYTVVPAAA